MKKNVSYGIMKTRIFMTALLLLAVSFAFGQNMVKDYAPHTKRGELPPVWLKNKVTEAQYDSLARLSKYYAVNYDYFKLRNLTKDDIRFYVKRTEAVLNEKSLKELAMHPNDTCCYDRYRYPVPVKPFKTVVEADGSRTVRYIVYSEIDGYDAHVALDVKISTTENGNLVFKDIKLLPYSLSGLKVKFEGNIRYLSAPKKGMFFVEQGEFDKEGKTPDYRIGGLLKVEDAMGYMHTELVEKHIFLTLKE